MRAYHLGNVLANFLKKLFDGFFIHSAVKHCRLEVASLYPLFLTIQSQREFLVTVSITIEVDSKSYAGVSI